MKTKSYLGELYIHIWDCQERFFNSDKFMWQSFFLLKIQFYYSYRSLFKHPIIYMCLQSTIYRLQSLEEMLETGEQTNKQ